MEFLDLKYIEYLTMRIISILIYHLILMDSFPNLTYEMQRRILDSKVYPCGVSIINCLMRSRDVEGIGFMDITTEFSMQNAPLQRI